jgi:hypothetical protein
MGASLYGKNKENPTLVEAAKEINDALESAQSLVWEAERIADEHGLSFSMNLGAYGMGGSYTPLEDGEEDEYGDLKESGWQASSQSC